jgi:hypothetical protein
MSNRRDASKKLGNGKGSPGDLALDVARLAEETGLDTSEVYAFLCGGGMGTGGPDWLDKEVSNDVRKHLRTLDS